VTVNVVVPPDQLTVIEVDWPMTIVEGLAEIVGVPSAGLTPTVSPAEQALAAPAELLSAIR
jgi:hypothetical protein